LGESLAARAFELRNEDPTHVIVYRDWVQLLLKSECPDSADAAELAYLEYINGWDQADPRTKKCLTFLGPLPSGQPRGSAEVRGVFYRQLSRGRPRQSAPAATILQRRTSTRYRTANSFIGSVALVARHTWGKSHIIKGRPFWSSFECQLNPSRKEHPLCFVLNISAWTCTKKAFRSQ
jgi:hypothetical protein